jgi:hypothetical protein
MFVDASDIAIDSILMQKYEKKLVSTSLLREPTTIEGRKELFDNGTGSPGNDL